MSARVVDGVSTGFALDPEGRVASVTEGGATVASYAYDVFDLRVAKTVPVDGVGDDGTIHFIYDLEGRLIAEHDGATGAALREYIYFGLMPVAFVSYDAVGNATVYAVHTDQVNMPQKLTDASGVIVYDRTYTPFGETVSAAGSLLVTLQFPGQREDGESNLFQNWHRDFDPSLGRYVQSDPIGLAGGINTYGYVGGNPLIAVDPEGLNSIPFGAIDFGGINRGLGSIVRGGAARTGGYGLAFYGAYELGNLIGEAISPSIAKGLVEAGLVEGFDIDENGNIISTPRDVPIPPQCPDDADCEEEWQDAIQICARRIGNPDWRGITGGYGNLYDCARGLVSERCGGNIIEH